LTKKPAKEDIEEDNEDEEDAEEEEEEEEEYEDSDPDLGLDEDVYDEEFSVDSGISQDFEILQKYFGEKSAAVSYTTEEIILETP
jgi:hypothetical protein